MVQILNNKHRYLYICKGEENYSRILGCFNIKTFTSVQISVGMLSMQSPEDFNF